MMSKISPSGTCRTNFKLSVKKLAPFCESKIDLDEVLKTVNAITACFLIDRTGDVLCLVLNYPSQNK